MGTCTATKDCGGTTVNITNRATQALYNYTPYQPNPATLAAPMGRTVHCGAYGNINFYRYMESWFGILSTAVSNVYIEDGVYSIQSVNSGTLLNVAGANPTPGARVQIFNDDGTASNWWSITRDSDGYYSLRNVATGNYADVAGGNFRRGTTVHSWTGNGTCSQKWAAVYENGRYKFLSKCSGLALDVAGGGTSNGTGLQIWTDNSTPAQYWNLIAHRAAPVADGFYSITGGSNMALDIVNAQTADGTATQIYNPNNSPAQTWQLVRLSDGTYTVRNPISNRYLYVAGDSVTVGSKVQIKNLDGGCAPRWNLVHIGNGAFNLLSACTATALDVTGGAVSTAGTPIQVWLANSTGSQQWKFTPVPESEIPAGTYSIRSVAKLALDVTGGNMSRGTKTQLWVPNGTVPQQWRLTKHSDGTHSIVNPGSGSYLDLTGGNSSAGTRTQIWDGNDTCAQKWNVSKNSDATYTFRSACAGLALDVAGGYINSPGAGIQVWSPNGTASQQWLFGNP